MIEHQANAPAAEDHEAVDKLATAQTGRKQYVKPRLIVVATTDELLEILGPAQANYSGTGFP